jgi:hypothetical protein
MSRMEHKCTLKIQAKLLFLNWNIGLFIIGRFYNSALLGILAREALLGAVNVPLNK